MFRSWPLLFIVIPLVELYCIIAVGEMIGAFWTIILVLLTAVVGVNLMRFQGMNTLARAQQNMAKGQIPAMEMMEGVALAVAGVLLITPGFITDSIGLLCLVPASRQLIVRFIMARATIHTVGGVRGFQQGRQPNFQQKHQQGFDAETQETKKSKAGHTLEGEYKREE